MPSTSPFIAETRIVSRTTLHPNPWNVNRMNAFQYGRLLESIDTYGFLDPILARPCVLHGDLEIIGGKHRYDASGDLLAKHPELDRLPVVVREMDDRTARKISLIDNELHGQADPGLLSDLLKDLLRDDPGDMLAGMPFTEDILKSLTGFQPLPPLPAAPPPTPPGSPSPGEGVAGKEAWVERTYRMPQSVAQVLDDAIEKARMEELGDSGRSLEVFQALEVLAAEYLAS